MLHFLRRTLEPRVGGVFTAGSAEEAPPLLARQHIDLLMLDIALPGKSGLAWLRELRDRGGPFEVVLIIAFADLETAIEALGAGASDFLLEPFRVTQVLEAVQHGLERSLLRRENWVLIRALSQRTPPAGGLVGRSIVIKALHEALARVAAVDSTVLHAHAAGGAALITRHLLEAARLDVGKGHGGAFTLIQRFGSAAHLNIHLHCLVLDGAYRCGADGTPTFVEASGRVPGRMCCPGGLSVDTGPPFRAGTCLAKSLRLQARARPARPMPRETAVRQHLCADIDGFSLHAAVRVEAHDRKRLEQLCRCITRPALPAERAWQGRTEAA